MLIENLISFDGSMIYFIDLSDMPNIEQENMDDIYCVQVQAEEIINKKKMFSVLAKKFCFPDYFGNNWDALNECLRDFEWLPAKGYILFINNAEELFSQVPKLAGTLLEIWLSSFEEIWRKEEVVFRIVFVWGK